MKIITRGVPPETKPVRLSCGNCSTVVECAQSEMAFTPDAERQGGYWQCVCPVCGAAIVTPTLKPAEEPLSRDERIERLQQEIQDLLAEEEASGAGG